ncbi:MAG: glutamate/gamma-aminobutyrate family transporter YjeM [Clostridioides sp.]|jgi:amino acid transporter|nr:glutamate/gamma-aminobutyrate family transporter YjeM [Clostridioides sp.]
MSNQNEKKLTLIPLILMIFTSVFGFTNIVRGFFLMGYSAIPWYVISAITFFIPYAFMLAEFGATFRKESGGIYSWMEKSVGGKYAFIVTFMWFTSYIIWMVNVSSSIWIPFTNLIFGQDTTQSFAFFGLNASQSLGILGIIFMLIVTFLSTKGLDKIQKVTNVGGTFVLLINALLIVGAIVVLALNGFHPAQPINAHSFVSSPNKDYLSTLSIFSFLVFAIFAYGGLEAVGGVVDQTENPGKTFPKGIKIAAITVTIGYAIGILCVGFFANWDKTMSMDTVNLPNVAYSTVGNLGYSLGQGFGLTTGTCEMLSNIFSRFVGLSMFLALTGAFFTLIYSPIKTLIEGTPKEIWPEFMTKNNEHGVPQNAMWIQCAIVVAIICVTAFLGGKGFLTYLILMANVSMTIPYMFVAMAFVPFKKLEGLDRPFEVYKRPGTILFCTILVVATVAFANVFTIIQPFIESGDLKSTLFQIAGPVIFSIIAVLLYNRYEKNYLKKNNDKVA